MVVVNVGDMWAKLVLIAVRAGSVVDSVKAEGRGTSNGELFVTALVDSVGRDPRIGDFASVKIFSWCGVLWLSGSAV